MIMDAELTDLIDNYLPPQKAIDLINSTQIAFLVGVSGAGKDTILRELLKSGQYRLIISHTTRKPRENRGILEQNGVEYHFINYDEAKQMLINNKFVEAKRYSGNVYGTSIAEIEKAQIEEKIAISDIEVQGVAEYRAVSSKVIPIFLLPPDFETWQRRLMSRYGGVNPDNEDMKLRMNTARRELKEALDKDYFEFVVNDDIPRAIKAVDEIAHGQFSREKNKLAKDIATELLARLSS